MEVIQKTNITPIENGSDQSRQVWSREKHRFILAFDARETSIIDAIVMHFKGQNGAYAPFWFPCYNQEIKGTRLGVNGAAKTITDSSAGFLTKGFNTDLNVWIAGSDESNAGEYGVATAVAATLTCDTGETLYTESANSDLAVYPAYYVRYESDVLSSSFIAPGISRIATLTLIEKI
jgi:hypothetical protein